eukprot:scaffold433_cov257-Pinguiococcus_pyrenoidosus.AAC.18
MEEVIGVFGGIEAAESSILEAEALGRRDPATLAEIPPSRCTGVSILGKASWRFVPERYCLLQLLTDARSLPLAAIQGRTWRDSD